MTEQVLCNVWQEILTRERIGIEDNFFSLGGDSILSVRVISILKRRGMVLNVKEIFQYQTIAGLAPRCVPHLRKQNTGLCSRLNC